MTVWEMFAGEPEDRRMEEGNARVKAHASGLPGPWSLPLCASEEIGVDDLVDYLFECCWRGDG
jgi:hypothetical protein